MSPSGINNKRGAMALSTWDTFWFRFLLFIAIGFLTVGTLQGNVVSKKVKGKVVPVLN
jgi:hypothetical protein